MSWSSSQTSSSTSHQSTKLIDFPLSRTDNKNASFAPLHRTVEVENLHEDLNDKKQLTSSSTTTTKRVLTKCFTIIGDGTDE